MKLNLKGKSALVTGGSRGIGTAICRDLAEEGVSLGINYNSSAAEAEALAEELSEKFGIKAIAIKGNLAEEDDIPSNVRIEIVQHIGERTIVVGDL